MENSLGKTYETMIAGAGQLIRLEKILQSIYVVKESLAKSIATESTSPEVREAQKNFLYFLERITENGHPLPTIGSGEPKTKRFTTMFSAVGDFQHKFKITPENQTPELFIGMMKEELEEYLYAVEEGDIVGICDALMDLLYVLLGGMLLHGLHAEQVYNMFFEVHNSNMSKLGPDGEPIYNENGKVMKGPDFRAPNLAQFIADDVNFVEL